MYCAEADSYSGLHFGLYDPEHTEFEVFRASDYPDLKLTDGWYWDIPIVRYGAEGPYDTSKEAYASAVYIDEEVAAEEGLQVFDMNAV